MKKMNFFSLVVASILFFSSCSNEQGKEVSTKDTISKDTINTNKFNFKIVDNLLAFSKFEDYEKVVNQPSQEQINEFKYVLSKAKDFQPLAYEPYTKVNRANRHKIINDDFFSSMLNKDKSIQIGEYIFKISPEKEKVYVLPARYRKEYQDLVNEKIDNKHIMVFSTGDDVLDSLRQSPTQKDTMSQRRFGICREGGIGGKNATLSLGGAQTAAADFVRYGIYFTLKATIYPMGSSGTDYNMSFEGDSWVFYRVRCGSTVDYGRFTTEGTWNGVERKYQSYQGSKNLNILFFAFRVYRKSTGQPVVPSNPVVVIRQNR